MAVWNAGRYRPAFSFASRPLLCDNLCERVCEMATNLGLDDELIREAQKLGNHRSKKEAVNAALDEYVTRRKQLGILKLFGRIDYDPRYDYKRTRRMKRG